MTEPVINSMQKKVSLIWPSEFVIKIHSCDIFKFVFYNLQIYVLNFFLWVRGKPHKLKKYLILCQIKISITYDFFWSLQELEFQIHMVFLYPYSFVLLNSVIWWINVKKYYSILLKTIVNFLLLSNYWNYCIFIVKALKFVNGIDIIVEVLKCTLLRLKSMKLRIFV